ncbi:signal peptide peptidase-like protein [Skeletonema marinoi]|uniref:Signal peptide peptidase-like protein n=1 Tax=Skeletonema marinoi TaxID=267567 RepID=A0AAD8YM60_9STRA|nr:signal peptide peptidase-like protein [Skeletonema marinoi]
MESNTLHAHGSNKGAKVTHPAHQLTLSPDTDYYLCKEAKGLADYKDGSKNSNIFDAYGTPITNDFPLNKYLLVPRGHCTFEAKARSAQRLGAKGIIVYNTLESRYKLIDPNKGTDSNSYSYSDVYDRPKNVPQWDNTIWPRNRIDYECGTSPAGNKGEYHPHKAGIRAEISVNELDFDPAPYDANKNDDKLTGTIVDGSLCAEYVGDDTTFVQRCPSERCLLTGRNATDDGSKLEACCAWDTPVVMNGDGDDDGDSYGDELMELVRSAELNDNSAEMEYISIVPYERWSPDVHYATIFLWIFASVTVWLACYQSSKEFRSSWKKISLAVNEGVLVFDRSARNSNAPAEEGRERAETEDTVDDNGNGDDTDAGDDANDATPKTDEDSNEDGFVGSPINNGEQATSEDQASNNGSNENAQNDSTSLDQGAERQPHTVNLQSNSTTAAVHMKECLGKDASEKLDSVAFLKYKWIDIGSLSYGYAFAIAWIVLGFTYVQPLSNIYYWMLQDVMGVLYCIFFLTAFQMNSAMIPVITMLLVFAYTVFYAILARDKLLGSSILWTLQEVLALASSQITVIIPLGPSLDFRGVFAMMGLGEILVPGLLISFAARYDAARMLVKKCARSSRNASSAASDVEFGSMPSQVDSDTKETQVHYYLGRVKKALFKGYFGPLVISYTLALLAAYLVDWMTGVTQATLMVAVADKIPALRSEAATEANNNLAETTSVA